jgi:hypothetical protein
MPHISPFWTFVYWTLHVFYLQCILSMYSYIGIYITLLLNRYLAEKSENRKYMLPPKTFLISPALFGCSSFFTNSSHLHLHALTHSFTYTHRILHSPTFTESLHHCSTLIAPLVASWHCFPTHTLSLPRTRHSTSSTSPQTHSLTCSPSCLPLE